MISSFFTVELHVSLNWQQFFTLVVRQMFGANRVTNAGAAISVDLDNFRLKQFFMTSRKGFAFKTCTFSILIGTSCFKMNWKRHLLRTHNFERFNDAKASQSGTGQATECGNLASPLHVGISPRDTTGESPLGQ